MENIVIAIIGEDRDAEDVLFKGFKNFNPEKVILLTKEGYEKKSELISKNLTKFNIESNLKKVSSFLHLEEVFKEIKEISQLHSKDNIVINVDTDYMSSCLALSSAFVNGIAAIGMMEEEIITYPIMKFSYYNAINDKKMSILRIINEQGIIESMEKLSKLAKMSLPLIAYHLKGNRDSKGLVEMNLVKTERENGSLNVSLTELGKLIVKGYVDFECVDCDKRSKKK